MRVVGIALALCKKPPLIFMNPTASVALNLIPENLKLQPIFLCIDDTMVSKFGKTFKKIPAIFGHATHNSSNYLNEYCFVSVMLSVPLFFCSTWIPHVAEKGVKTRTGS